MQTIRDVLGPDVQDPFVTLAWSGRKESAAELALRVSATQKRVAAQLSDASLPWVRGPLGAETELMPVPTDLNDFAEVIEASFDRTLGEYASRAVFNLFVDDPLIDQDEQFLSISFGVGSGNSNSVILRLLDDFPLDSPAEAARFLLDLMRIWQPDSAELMTTSAALAALGRGPYNHVGYMLWTSDNAYGPDADLEREIVIPHADGRLHVTRVWTDDAVVALFEELG